MLGIDFSDGGEGEEFNPMAGPQPCAQGLRGELPGSQL